MRKMELLILGLDGLSYNMLQEFDVDTPFLDQVRNSGISGELRSVDTPTTLPAWTSFATGKDPGSHGLASMLEQSQDYSISSARVNKSDIAAFDLIEEGLFINLPGSVGRKPVADRTKLVSSFLSANREDAVPDSLRTLDAYDNYVVHAEETLKSNPERYFKHLMRTTEARHAFAAEALDREQPRVGFVLFSTPDWVGHHLQLASDDSTRQRWYQSVVEACDEYAADLASRARNILLLSDHGFEHKPKAIHLQTWLKDKGYVETGDQMALHERVVTGTAKQIAKRFDTLFDILRTAYLRITKTTGGTKLQNAVNFNPDINFERSQAWQLRYGCIYLNSDRFVSPTVTNTHEVREQLRNELAAITDDDGNPIFESVNYPENVYENPQSEVMLPDIIARPASGFLPLRAFSPTGKPVIETPGHDHYDHRYEGIIAAQGPKFKSGTVEGMSIIDVLPTVMHALQEPLLREFDGKVMKNILTSDVPVEFVSEESVPSPKMRGAEVYNEQVAMNRLEDLGYLE